MNDSDLAITNGDPVKSWAFATGGTATQALAVAAGADPQYLTWVAASGVHTSGLNAALTLPTPVTIPAATDCVIYALIKLPVTSQLLALGNSTSALTRIDIGGDGEVSGNVTIDGSNQALSYWASATTTATLYRFRRSGSTWYAARTGDAEQTMSNTGTPTGAIVFDTLLAYGGSGTGLDAFSPTGNYLQKLYIYHGSSTPNTAYEIANGGAL
jgi:hypothetical protein